MALPRPYSPLNWFWKVGGSTTQVWSSKSMSYLLVSNTTYATWATGNTPTPIANAGQLLQVMYAQVEPYVMGNGVAVTSSGTSALNATYSCSASSFTRLNTICAMIANSKGLPGGGGTFLYPDVSGNFKTFSSTNILNLTAGLSTFMYNWESAISTLVGGGSTTIPSSVSIA